VETPEVFSEREYRALVRFAFLLCGDAGEAEEIAEEAMARVYERWDRVGSMGSPGGYTDRVA
jgi:DNA-directed RNA polymerase specialized sigma24 family protein